MRTRLQGLHGLGQRARANEAAAGQQLVQHGAQRARVAVLQGLDDGPPLPRQFVEEQSAQAVEGGGRASDGREALGLVPERGLFRPGGASRQAQFHGLAQGLFADGFAQGFDKAAGQQAAAPGMVELGEDIFLKPVRKGVPLYGGPLSDMVANPRSATVMGLLEEARLSRVRGHRAAQQAGSVQSMFGRVKDWFIGNF